MRWTAADLAIPLRLVASEAGLTHIGRIPSQRSVGIRSLADSLPSPRLGAVVTGAGSGIGRALSLALVARGLHIVAVGRRRDALRETCGLAEELSLGIAEALPADISSEHGREAVAARMVELRGAGHAHLAHVVHNAALLGPVGSLKLLTRAGFREALATNVEGPLFLTRALAPLLAEAPGGGRVLHVSSGAAHVPIQGWLSYCTSKAALLQVMRCLDQELACQGVRVGSAMPGVVDTPMQEELRALEFPDVGHFRVLGEAAKGAAGRGGSEGLGLPVAPPEGCLDRPENVADFLAWLLLDVRPEEFGGREWDIHDPTTQRQWLARRDIS